MFGLEPSDLTVNDNNTGDGTTVNTIDLLDDPFDLVDSDIDSAGYIGEIPWSPGDYGFFQENASSFNVTEKIVAISPWAENYTSALIDIDTENYTQEIPDGWDFEGQQMNISAIYKDWEMILGLNNQSIIDEYNDWVFDGYTTSDEDIEKLKNGEFVGSGSTADEIDVEIISNINMTGSDDMGYLNITGGKAYDTTGMFAEPISGIITDDVYANWQLSLFKPDEDLEIYGTRQLWEGYDDTVLFNAFYTDPTEWSEDYENPFGGFTGTRVNDLSWSGVTSGYLDCEIGAATSTSGLGSPSIGWGSYFYWDSSYNPENVYMGIQWSVENLDYESADNVSVICMIDGIPIDGRYDAQGNIYTNATATTLECDDGLHGKEIQSHDAITRVYDVSDLVVRGRNWHEIEFGVWMKSPDETQDQVSVKLHAIQIVILEEDQYKIGELGFSIKPADTPDWLQGINESKLYVTFSAGNESMILPLGYLNESLLLDVDTWNTITVDIPHKYEPILNQAEFNYSIGLYYNDPRSIYFEEEFALLLDNLTLNLTYKCTDYDDMDVKRWDGSNYVKVDGPEYVTTDTFNDVTDEFVIDYQLDNSEYAGSKMAFFSVINMTTVKEDEALASYFIDFDEIDTIYWNITYNNEETIDQIPTWEETLNNFETFAYVFTINDLPAYDGLGAQSVDWDIDDAGAYSYVPDGYTNVLEAAMVNFDGKDALHQDLLVIQVANPLRILLGYNTSWINGTWGCLAFSPNYLSSISLQNPITYEDTYKVYDGNQTNIVANRTNFGYAEPEPTSGNYNVTILSESSSDVLSQSSPILPNYSADVVGNLSVPWDVEDNGLGGYILLGTWTDNDTQTTRVGISYNEFEMWRATYGVVSTPTSVYVGPGDSITYNVSVWDISSNITGAEDYINVYRTSTGDLWGTDWTPFEYLLDSVDPITNLPGNYSINLDTGSVSTGIYDVYIEISYEYYDPVILNCIIGISSTDYLYVNYISGVINKTGIDFLTQNNIPTVNSTTESSIIFSVDDINGSKSGVVVSGTFNGTMNTFYGYELYTKTLDPSDIGVYQLDLDATYLNSTINSIYSNYTLSISISRAGYESESLNISTSVLLMSSVMDSDPISDIYEGGEIEHYVSYESIYGDYINNGNVLWNITELGGSSLGNGTFGLLLNGIYGGTIQSTTDDYDLGAGTYYLIVSATSRNCEDGLLNITVNILAKGDTTIDLTLSGEKGSIRIGNYLYVSANLTLANGSVMDNEEVIFTLSFGNDLIFDISSLTDDGIASYSQLISFLYANENMTVIARYVGSDILNNCSASETVLILGKLDVNISLDYNVTALRPGYQILISVNVTIEEKTSQYSDIYLTISYWYDGLDTQQVVYYLQCDSTGNIELETEEIEDGHDNITLHVDYAGSQTEHQYTNETTLTLLPKWGIQTNIVYEYTELRPGYPLQFTVNITIDGKNDSYEGTYLTLEYLYDGFPHTRVVSYSECNSTGFVEFYISSIDNDARNITFIVIYEGSSTVMEIIDEVTIPLEPKWNISLNIENLATLIGLTRGGTYEFDIQASLEVGCLLEISGLLIQLEFFNGTSHFEEAYLDEFGKMSLQFRIPDYFGNSMTLFMRFAGTEKIDMAQNSLNFTLLDKTPTLIELETSNELQGFETDEYAFKITLYATEGNEKTPLGGEEITFRVISLDKNGEMEEELYMTTITTSSDGTASFTYKFIDDGTGFYRVEIYFGGLSTFAASETVNVEVEVDDYMTLFVKNLDIIAIVLGSLAIAAVTYRKGVVIPRREKRKLEQLKIHQIFADIENVQFLLIIHKDSGMTFFSHSFTKIPIDESLISGFLSAIGSFGMEIGGKMDSVEGVGGKYMSPTDQLAKLGTPKQRGLEELNFQQFKIALTEGEYIKTAVLLLKSASVTFKDKVKKFNNEFEGIYRDQLVDWKGKTPGSEPIVRLLEEHLDADLLYVHNVISMKVQDYIKDNRVKKDSLKSHIFKDSADIFENSFYLREIINRMTAYGQREVDTFNAINELRKDSVVFAINPRTQTLIDKFEPLIKGLTQIEVQFLQILGDQSSDVQTVAKKLGLERNEMNRSDVQTVAKKLGLERNEMNKVLFNLKSRTFIDEEYNITDTGEIVSMLSKLMPNL